jgi:tRNA(fMet)-specific endonuclease VapC
MKFVLFDTNVVVGMVRNDGFEAHLDKIYPYTENRILLSVVSQGELQSLAIQWKWGPKKLLRLDRLYEKFVIYPIKMEKVINAYAQIDAYSQSKLPEQPLPMGLSARNMGKNDLWIAATAHATQATLLTPTPISTTSTTLFGIWTGLTYFPIFDPKKWPLAISH